MSEKNKATLYPLWSKPVYAKKLNFDTKKIVSKLEKYEFVEAGVEGENTAKDILSATKNLNVLDDKVFKYLKKMLIDEFYLFINEHMKYTNEFKITTSWFNKNLKGQSSNWHNHNNSMYSAVLYLQTDENSGKISFYNFSNQRFALSVTDYNILNCENWKINPIDGMLLIFPSEMYHRIEENESNIVRYSLAFNFLPTGLLGRTDADSHAKINIEK